MGQPSTREMCSDSSNIKRTRVTMSSPARSTDMRSSRHSTFTLTRMTPGGSALHLVRIMACCVTPSPASLCPLVGGSIGMLSHGKLTAPSSSALGLCLLCPASSWWRPLEPLLRCGQTAWESSPGPRGGGWGGQSTPTRRGSSCVTVVVTMAG